MEVFQLTTYYIRGAELPEKDGFINDGGQLR